MNNRQKKMGYNAAAGVHGAGQPTFRRKHGKKHMKEFTIGQNDAGQRLDRFLAKAVPLLPASLAQKYIRLKRIKCNGKRVDRDTRLQEGDVLQLYINDEFFDKPREDNAYLTVATRRSSTLSMRTKTFCLWTSAPALPCIPTTARSTAAP